MKTTTPRRPKLPSWTQMKRDARKFDPIRKAMETDPVARALWRKVTQSKSIAEDPRSLQRMQRWIKIIHQIAEKKMPQRDYDRLNRALSKEIASETKEAEWLNTTMHAMDDPLAKKLMELFEQSPEGSNNQRKYATLLTKAIDGELSAEEKDALAKKLKVRWN